MASELPACEWRVDTHLENRCYCRHGAIASVSGIIDRMACRVCPVRLTNNPSPRPILSAEQLKKVVDLPPTMPSIASQLWNLSRAVKDFIADGMQTVDAAEYSERLTICETCENRLGDRCTRCGCQLTLKAQGRVFQCPDNRWPLHQK
jgi:hypothetical protein